MVDQAERLRELSERCIALNEKGGEPECAAAHVLAIASGKGGVGKSSFAVNLALALANYGKKVLIVDADIGMANIDVMMGLIAKYSLIDIIEGVRSFEEVVVTGPRNIKFLPGGSGIKSLVSLTNLELQRILSQASQFEKAMDFILLDTGAGMGDTVMNFLMAADDILLVATPEPTSLTDAYALIKAYAGNDNAGKAALRLVVNRVGSAAESSVVADKLCKVAVKFLSVQLRQIGYIFEDPAVSQSIRSQRPLLLQSPDSPAAGCIAGIARKLILGFEPADKKGRYGFFKKFLNINSRK
ncbi:MAG: MinD/ParA family protein [Acidaminococcales bacterium]|jgi:flagellar biosynthesis protein FlhG|nr:MinD/ParA family protein [Acidaminococcales bacterium]